MHKERKPGSIPVPSTGTYSYNLFKYLCGLLTLHILFEHCAIDTFSFDVIFKMYLYMVNFWFHLT